MTNNEYTQQLADIKALTKMAVTNQEAIDTKLESVDKQLIEQGKTAISMHETVSLTDDKIDNYGKQIKELKENGDDLVGIVLGLSDEYNKSKALQDDQINATSDITTTIQLMNSATGDHMLKVDDLFTKNNESHTELMIHVSDAVSSLKESVDALDVAEHTQLILEAIKELNGLVSDLITLEKDNHVELINKLDQEIAAINEQTKQSVKVETQLENNLSTSRTATARLDALTTMLSSIQENNL